MKKTLSPAYIVVLILALALLIGALTISPLSELSVSSDSAYPILISAIGVLLAVKIALDDYKAKKAAAHIEEKAAEAPEEKAAAQTEENFAEVPELKVLNRDVLVVIGLMVLYGVLLLLCGYIISTLVFSVAAISYLYKHNWKTGALIGFIATFMIVLVFKYGFSVILP